MNQLATPPLKVDILKYELTEKKRDTLEQEQQQVVKQAADHVEDNREGKLQLHVCSVAWPNSTLYDFLDSSVSC